MNVLMGSARGDERGKASGGSAGDQKQRTVPDYAGEVSMQDYYMHPYGWRGFRAKNPVHAIGIASAMITACNNPNLGYDQNQRTGVVKNGTASNVKTECDCSSLVRQCIREATGVDPGNFTTANEASALVNTGLFDEFECNKDTQMFTGDIVVTKKKGHTGVITAGAPRAIAAKLYPVYSGKTTSIVTALAAVGEKNTSYDHRARIAAANGIDGYRGTAVQNTTMLNSLKLGKLIRVA